jgi:hypothetical protein
MLQTWPASAITSAPSVCAVANGLVTADADRVKGRISIQSSGKSGEAWHHALQGARILGEGESELRAAILPNIGGWAVLCMVWIGHLVTTPMHFEETTRQFLNRYENRYDFKKGG